jgi:NAD(P)-dependent dehydrogenase (short-subunit alcohol dehydrogenase family)
MARVFISGSTTGLGLGAAVELLDNGHQVVLHARSKDRLDAIDHVVSRASGVAIGDLANRTEVAQVAEQVNAIGGIDAVIHNAAVYGQSERGTTPEGHARTFAVNVLAPYLLTSWIEQPSRLVYLSSELHKSGDAALDDVDWITRRWNGAQAYSDSKLLITALSLALARRFEDRLVNVVHPGWVPTRMGGSAATDDLELGHRTQAWLASSEEPQARTSGGYWFHQQRLEPLAITADARFQQTLLDRLAEITGIALA